MNRLAAALLLVAVCAAPAWSQTYLGNLGTNRYGTYGSPYSSQSPRNPQGNGVRLIGDDD